MRVSGDINEQGQPFDVDEVADRNEQLGYVLSMWSTKIKG
jgi:hypothetical protein